MTARTRVAALVLLVPALMAFAVSSASANDIEVGKGYAVQGPLYFSNGEQGSTDVFMNVDYTTHVIRPYGEAGLRSSDVYYNCGTGKCYVAITDKLTQDGAAVTTASAGMALNQSTNNYLTVGTNTRPCGGGHGFRSYETSYAITNSAGQTISNDFVSGLVQSTCIR